MERETYYSSGKYLGEGERKSRTTIVPRKQLDLKIEPLGDTIATSKQEEWTTSKKVVNHKTKQVETRVQRQIVMEDGKVIADSGPQITTKTKEDQKKEESENTHHKNTGDIDTPPKKGYTLVPGNQVHSEKTETHNTVREVKEENMQYHDESFKELTGFDVHQKALAAPNELIKLDSNDILDSPRGKMIHYSSKGNKISDSEEVKEISKMGKDGSIETETTRTHHHEEVNDDELPEDGHDSVALPQASHEVLRNVEYLKNYPDGTGRSSRTMQGRNLKAIEDVKGRSQWVDDFGSDESDIVETGATRPASNMINIEMKSDRGSRYSTSRSGTPQKKSYKTTATYYLGDSSPSPRATPTRRDYSKETKADYSHRYSQRKDVRYERDSPASDHFISRSPRDTRFREDASVQASLSDSDEHDSSEVEIGKVYRSKEVKQHSKIHQPQMAKNSFYFGDENDESFKNSPDYRNFKNIENEILNTYQNIERESKLTSKSPLDENYNYIPRTSSRTSERKENRYDSFGYKFSEEKDRSMEVKDRSWLDTHTFEDNWRPSTGLKEYIHHPVIENGSYRRDPLTRQRSSELFTSPPPPQTSYSTSSRLMSKGGFDEEYSSSQRYSPTFSPTSPTTGTWTKSKGARLSPILRSSSPSDFPEFTPLSSPTEIKNIGSFKRTNYI